MGSKGTGIAVIALIVAVIGGYMWWENTRGADGQMKLEEANPNAPAVSEPANPGGGPMKQTP